MAPRNNSWKTPILLGFVLVTVGISSGAWFYRNSRNRQAAQSPANPTPAVRPVAAIAVAAPSNTSATNAPPASNLLDIQTPARPHFQVSVDPMQEFSENLKSDLVRQLSPNFPELPKYLGIEGDKGADPELRNFTFQLLDGVARAPESDQPGMLLAADLLASKIWCGDENKEACEQVRREFTQRNLTFAHEELGGGFYYSRDLLWHVWRDYPASDAGERAFIVLLDLGWDTSGVCAKGADQFQEVIRRGESFLKDRPTSPNRGVVTILVGQAYATWWALSNQTSGEMSDYVDPQRYQTGAREARLKAIDYFESALQVAPNTKLAEYASQVLSPLRLEQVPEEYKFFCIYD
jgi:hypothetical protein